MFYTVWIQLTWKTDNRNTKTLLGLKDGVEQRFVISSKWSLNKVVSYRCSRPSTKLRDGIRCFTLCIIACSNINSYEGVIKKRWERPDCLFLAEQNKNNARGTCNSRMQTQWLSHVQLTRNSMHIKNEESFWYCVGFLAKTTIQNLRFVLLLTGHAMVDATMIGGRRAHWLDVSRSFAFPNLIGGYFEIQSVCIF